jgi:hypothetical protein
MKTIGHESFISGGFKYLRHGPGHRLPVTASWSDSLLIVEASWSQFFVLDLKKMGYLVLLIRIIKKDQEDIFAL